MRIIRNLILLLRCWEGEEKKVNNGKMLIKNIGNLV